MTRAIGPYTRTLAHVDGRTVEGRLMRDTRKALVAHVGGSPSATQKALIERAVQLTLRVAAMDRKFAETGEQTEHDSKTYLAWSASLSRIMRDLGPPVAQRRKSVQEILAEQRHTVAA